LKSQSSVNRSTKRVELVDDSFFFFLLHLFFSLAADLALRGVFQPYVSLSRFVILLVVAALDGFVELDNFFVLQENCTFLSPVAVGLRYIMLLSLQPFDIDLCGSKIPAGTKY